MSFGTPVELGVDNEGQRNVAGVRTYRRQFYVLATATTDDEYGAVNATGIPAIGDAHPSDSGARLRDKRAKRESADARLKWIVDCQYSSGTATTAQPDNPLSRDPDISLDTEYIDRIPTAAFNGTNWTTAVANTAGDLFDPPPSIQVPVTVIRIGRNESSFTVSTKNTYEGTVNSATLTIAGQSLTARQALMRSITASKATENGTTYYRVNYEILVADLNGPTIGTSPDAVATTTHDLVIANTGYFQLVGGVKAPCLVTSTGEPANVPQLLAADGTQLSISGAPVWLSFRVRREQAWSGLSLPSTF
jgi:hypothetical protein